MKYPFTLEVFGGLLSWEQRDCLLNINSDFDITQRKNYAEYYHNISDVDVELSVEDIDTLSTWFKVKWYENYNIVLEVVF